MPEFALLGQIAALVREWDRELHQEDLARRVWERCQVLGPYGKWDLEAFTRLLRSPERAPLMRAFEEGWTALRCLDELPPHPEAKQLYEQLAQRWKVFHGPVTPETHTAARAGLETIDDQWLSFIMNMSRWTMD